MANVMIYATPQNAISRQWIYGNETQIFVTETEVYHNDEKQKEHRGRIGNITGVHADSGSRLYNDWKKKNGF